MRLRNFSAIVMLFALALCGWQATHGAKPKDEMMELYGLFVDAVEQVEANYVRPVNRRELLESALRGMLHDLDPHSQFITETEWKSFRKQIEGRYGGIGIQVEIEQDTERLRVLAPLVGSPAYAAGILSGDIIVEIDGQSTEGMTTDRAVEVLTGRIGTPVKLTVRHEGDNKIETLSMNRAIIDVPSVLGDSRNADDSWNYMLDADKKIGYIRITSFIQTTTDELKQALSQLKGEGMKALILDLRDDPGGLLSAAVEVSDMFIDAGVIVTTKGRNTPSKPYEAQKDGEYTDFPMAVLVNSGSASAAEIVSACLQDHKRAKVIGQRSYGKGSVQNIIELEGGNSILKLTVASYYRPSGKNIHRFKNAKDTDEWGVTPDKGLEVKLSPREYFAFAKARRDRDLVTTRRSRKPEAAKPEENAKKAEKEGQGEEPAKTKETPKPETRPFKDTQRDKALAVVKEELASASAKK